MDRKTEPKWLRHVYLMAAVLFSVTAVASAVTGPWWDALGHAALAFLFFGLWRKSKANQAL